MAEEGVNLDTHQADKKVWLVKFPPAVAKRLHELAAQPSPDGTGPSLGVVRRTQNSGERADEFRLELDAGAFPGIPANYAMRPNTGGGEDNAFTFCVDGESLAVDGRVGQRFDVGMLNNDEQQAPVDPQYRSLTRERKEKAATKTRVMQIIDDPRALSTRVLPQVTAQKRVVKNTDSKRMRMDRDALENMLFGLFERQPAWPFMQLEKETNQPVPWLKEVLSGIAAFNRSAGVNQSKWQLKKDFQLGGQT
mmetsp:Transcript_19340/g.58443  ORF Transcript_19340/g.58443 Transcript_19340/m.58443 type:complete len:250 (-) Transcript_19340:190-939(-)|eukprot:CAMPEP_0206141660 /NCGR_PEP_ID=MMETSP1473-20131121/13731_1 /ASSEMBLY_ACC=CAM_ASM_001109 /TAXON_ID=1461547 /ORGANISM="Stichococcus sp, Strain RCC1054" /LENGTH=249 /DNA_ID=CAMNT_0053536321 /DNA_START=351 /DNA_END=1100 /DNA_ORIENTATION=-